MALLKFSYTSISPPLGQPSPNIQLAKGQQEEKAPVAANHLQRGPSTTLVLWQVSKSSNEQPLLVPFAGLKSNAWPPANGPACRLVVYADVDLVSLVCDKTIFECLILPVIIHETVIWINVIIVSSAKLALR